MKNDCVFCAIAAGEIPSFKVYEDELVLAYLDINPFSEGHTLVIPKAHTTGLLDTPEETLAALLARVKKVAGGELKITVDNIKTGSVQAEHAVKPRAEGRKESQ